MLSSHSFRRQIVIVLISEAHPLISPPKQISQPRLSPNLHSGNLKKVPTCCHIYTLRVHKTPEKKTIRSPKSICPGASFITLPMALITFPACAEELVHNGCLFIGCMTHKPTQRDWDFFGVFSFKKVVRP